MAEWDTTQKQGACLHPSPKVAFWGLVPCSSFPPKPLQLRGGTTNKVGQGQETYVPIPALPPKSYMTLGKSFTFLSSHPSSDTLITSAQQEADDSLIVLNGESAEWLTVHLYPATNATQMWEAIDMCWNETISK